MSFYEDWFSFSARRNRKSFILASLCVFGIIAAVFLVLAIVFDVGAGSGAIVFALFAIPAAIAGYTLTAQRLRDFNATGWLALLWIPIGMLPEPFYAVCTVAFWIVLCGIPGTLGPNRYGSDPLSDLAVFE